MKEKRIAKRSVKAGGMNKANDDASIRPAAAEDPDTFMPDADWFARAQLVAPLTKEMVTLRLDQDVLQYFRVAGRGYQTRINAVLKAFVDSRGGKGRKRIECAGKRCFLTRPARRWRWSPLCRRGEALSRHSCRLAFRAPAPQTSDPSQTGAPSGGRYS